LGILLHEALDVVSGIFGREVLPGLKARCVLNPVGPEQVRKFGDRLSFGQRRKGLVIHISFGLSVRRRGPDRFAGLLGRAAPASERCAQRERDKKSNEVFVELLEHELLPGKYAF
jgi:hypothetical protein